MKKKGAVLKTTMNAVKGRRGQEELSNTCNCN